MMRNRARLVLAALAVSLTLTFTACVPNLFVHSTGDSTPTGEQVSAEEAPYYHQVIHWKSCWSGFSCAKVKAPINWADPAQGEISLALVKHDASQSNPLGDLLVNPGGPGASAVDFVHNSLSRATTEQLSAAYNIVGFDPRGVGHSTPVTCFTEDSQMDELLYSITPGTRGSAEWLQNRAAEAKAYVDACAKNTGELLNHLSTEDTAHDMDMIRAALGQQKLNYLGYSYGTRLGALYADQYPSKVGRMVLDGALDPAASSNDEIVFQAQGFETALRNFVQWCLEQSDCPLSGSVEAGMNQISALLAQVDAHPLTADDGRQVGADTLVTAIAYPLYSRDAWPYLSSILTDTLAGQAETALGSADGYNERNSDGSYASNSTEAFTAINCADYVAVTDPAVVSAQLAKLHQVAPVLGEYFGYGDTLCGQWPSAAVPTVDHGPVVAAGSPDILVVGTVYDPATPYSRAVVLAAELPHGHLVTYQGNGHTAYGQSSTCINSVVDDFFLTGAVPTSDPNCPAV